jgi:hypothetical protein
LPGAIHGEIGPAHEFLGIGRIGWIEGGAEADADVDFRAILERDRAYQRILICIIMFEDELISAAANHGKFVTAEPWRRRAVPISARSKPLANFG